MIHEGDICCQQENDTRVLHGRESAPVKPRSKGPRNWNEVPDSELQAIGAQVLAHLKCIPGCDDHLKGIATYLGIARLTRPLREQLLQLLNPPA